MQLVLFTRTQKYFMDIHIRLYVLQMTFRISMAKHSTYYWDFDRQYIVFID